jgi:hypothetical protein
MQRSAFPNLAELEHRQWLNRAEVELRQPEKLRQLMQIAIANFLA